MKEKDKKTIPVSKEEIETFNETFANFTTNLKARLEDLKESTSDEITLSDSCLGLTIYLRTNKLEPNELSNLGFQLFNNLLQNKLNSIPRYIG